MAPLLLPHRTAWSTPAEFLLVFRALFESDADPQRQLEAISRIKVWQTRASCPHAVESTANFLELILRDAATPAQSGGYRPSAHELRLGYSMAIIRFVNSLVDPLQTTYFARSIASLAAQLGLPLWFVELRHQATHEELPALPVLRDGARQALDWLYTHYWLPAISSSSSSSSSFSSPRSNPLPSAALEPLRASLASYKSLQKTLLKDASQAGRIKNELWRLYRDLGRWAAEHGAGVGGAATTTAPPGKGRGGKPAASAEREVAAMRERVMDAIVSVLVDEAGGLVPLAKKKRPTARSPFLPTALSALWTPLLTFLDTTVFPSSPSSEAEDEDSDGFLEILVARMVELICSPPWEGEGPGKERESEGANVKGREGDERSYLLTLQAWVVHLVDDQDTIEGVIKTCLLAGTPSATALVDALCTSRSGEESTPNPLPERVKPLVAVLRNADSGFAPALEADEAERRIDEMMRRLAEMEAKQAVPSPSPSRSRSPATRSSLSSTSSVAAPPPSSAPASSWRTLEAFKPSPIGALPAGGVESLDLAPLAVVPPPV
ncbi:hypothetical protein JCM1841_003197 [Sporobolomyces salmonicolor]